MSITQEVVDKFLRNLSQQWDVSLATNWFRWQSTYRNVFIEIYTTVWYGQL